MPKRFQRVYIEISNICNLQCHFCPEVERAKKVMDLSLFQKTIGQLQGLTEEVTFHLMGEPMAHPQFAEFVDHCADVGMPVNLTSNATLLKNRERAEKLLSPAIRQVNFSLQSFAANFPQMDPQEYLGHIFRWTKVALELRPDLYINYRLWNMGSDDALTNCGYLAAIGREFNVSLNSQVDVGSVKSKRLMGRLYLHFDSRFDWPKMQDPVRALNGYCYALQNHFGILADGTIVPCCLDKEAQIGIGHVSLGIINALNSQRALNLRTGFDQFKLCEGLCQRCNFISRFDKKRPRTDTAEQVLKNKPSYGTVTL